LIYNLYMSKFVYWLPTLIWMAIIFSFSAQPSLHASSVDWQDLVIKKSAHFGEYFILAVLVNYSLRRTTQFSRSKRLIYTILFILIYAGSDEFHQLFTPGRESRIRDVAIDVFGGSTGIILYNSFSGSFVK
jgi:VanZ family protein